MRTGCGRDAGGRRDGTGKTSNDSHMSIEKVNIKEKFAQFTDHWNPRIAGELNGQYIKLAKFSGEFIWHKHDHEDEMFLVIAGHFRMELREKSINLEPGDFLIVPKGTEHKPVAISEEVEVMLFEPATTLNTGDQEKSGLTREKLERL
jgi:mannose-6-phosphate isomerase-like protein (cupin superfamily)